MGPPRERGGELTTGGTTIAASDAASMGPPRERGGEARGSRSGRRRTGRFNGAAARTRRRVRIRGDRSGAVEVASMGPPRERGGELARRRVRGCEQLASMGPPRERGGEMVSRSRPCAPHTPLQWGRRANAAESHRGRPGRVGRAPASMGPPRERGGETSRSRPRAPAQPSFNGAAARTRRRACRSRPVRPGSRRGFNGAAARTRRRGEPRYAIRPASG